MNCTWTYVEIFNYTAEMYNFRWIQLKYAKTSKMWLLRILRWSSRDLCHPAVIFKNLSHEICAILVVISDDAALVINNTLLINDKIIPIGIPTLIMRKNGQAETLAITHVNVSFITFRVYFSK